MTGVCDLNDTQMPDEQEEVRNEKNLKTCNTEKDEEIVVDTPNTKFKPTKKRPPRKKRIRRKKKKSFWDIIWG